MLFQFEDMTVRKKYDYGEAQSAQNISERNSLTKVTQQWITVLVSLEFLRVFYY